MSEAPAETVGTKRSDWTNGKPFVVTDEHVTMPWSGYRDGRMFRCHLCGTFFKSGDVVRLVWCNGVKEARAAGVHCGNVMVCCPCDGQDIYVRLAEHGRIGKERYWSMCDPERLPRSPHVAPGTGSQRSGGR